jgi:hypothetical protein
LVLSVVAGVSLIGDPVGRLPGIALGSEAILVAERIAVLFAMWLVALVVVARALAGDLPIEVSGRGVRYADLDVSQDELLDSRKAFEDLDREMEVLADAVVALEQAQAGHPGSIRRYAMRDEGGHGH